MLWNDLGDDRVRLRGQLGLAWRQLGSSRWNGLARLDRRFERLGLSADDRATHGATVLSAHLNWQATRRLVLSGRWASKWASDSTAGIASTSQAHLAMARAIQDIGRSWDLGIQATTLMVRDDGRRFGRGAELGRRLVDDLRLDLKFDERLLGLPRDRGRARIDPMASTEGLGYIPPMPPQHAPDRRPRFGTVLIRVLAVQIVTLLLLWLLQSHYAR